MSQMLIVGAGLSGLIAASMLREQCGSIFEAQSALPNNHSALLRFRSSVVGDAVGIPFRKVKVMKSVQPWRNPVADALAYSRKVSGRVSLRSSTTAAGEIEERYIAPPDLISQLASQVRGKIAYDQTMADALSFSLGPIISTIPMPTLMEALGWEEKPAFHHQPGEVITVDLPAADFSVCATVYIPDPQEAPYRVSITDNRLIIEMAGQGPVVPEEAISCALHALGLSWGSIFEHCVREHKRKQMTYAKIVPIDEGLRRRFIMWASTEHNIYSLGRFATWRPGLLLDDLVNDVRVIQRLESNPGETYTHHKKV